MSLDAGGSPDGGTVPVLSTSRLLMRAFEPADRDAFVAMNQDPSVVRHLQGPLSPASTDAFLERIERCWDERGYGLWALQLRRTGQFVGFTGLWPADFLPSGPAIEVGWRLTTEAWGQGYASEAGRRALDFGFANLGLAELVSFTAVDNTGSIRVMRAIGLRRAADRDFDHPGVDPDAYPQLVRHVFYAMTRAAWQPRVETDASSMTSTT